MECPNCHAENTADSRFCSRCATPLDPEEDSSGAFLTKILTTPLAGRGPGRLIAGKYRVVGEIGRGGMGIVYRAEDVRLQRTVALKFLPPALSESAEIKERFLIEARVGRGALAPEHLRHPRGRRKGRPSLYRHGIRRRRDPPGQARQDVPDHGSGSGPRDPGDRRIVRGPPQGHRPSGRQERQHHGHGQGSGQGYGLRAGQTAGAGVP